MQMLRPRRGLYAALSAMHDCRLLERLITGFGRISGRMIRDFYHKYTVDEHTLLTVRGIERLVTHPSRRPRFAELLAGLRSPERLVLALLLHDIGKWKDENHAEESARMAPGRLRRARSRRRDPPRGRVPDCPASRDVAGHLPA